MAVGMATPGRPGKDRCQGPARGQARCPRSCRPASPATVAGHWMPWAIRRFSFNRLTDIIWWVKHRVNTMLFKDMDFNILKHWLNTTVNRILRDVKMLKSVHSAGPDGAPRVHRLERCWDWKSSAPCGPQHRGPSGLQSLTSAWLRLSGASGSAVEIPINGTPMGSNICLYHMYIHTHLHGHLCMYEHIVT